MFCTTLILAMVLSLLPAVLQAKPDELTDTSLLFVGVKVNGQPVPDWDVYSSESDFWLPLALIGEYLSIDSIDAGAHTGADSVVLRSPLGSVSVPISKTASHPVSGRHLSSADLWEMLKVKTVFNDAEYTINFVTPWSKEDNANAEIEKLDEEIDFPAPKGSLSFIRMENLSNYELSDSASTSYTSLSFGGSAGNGSWLFSSNHGELDNNNITDLFWNKNFRQSAFRVGTNYVKVSPLFESQRFTGVQTAWTNDSILAFTDFDLNPGYDSFLTDDIEVLQNILRTDGPPAGIAELKLDGNRVALVRIDLSGGYEFRNILHDQGDYRQIEIHLYEHNVAEKPVRVIDLTQNTVDQMLGTKQSLLRAGYGVEGVAFNSTEDTFRPIGFVQYRYGVTDKLTLQSAFQTNPDNSQSTMLGIRASLGPHWAFATDAGQRLKKHALRLGVSGRYDTVDHEFKATYFESGYHTVFENISDSYDIRYRGSWQRSSDLQFGIYARKYWKDNRVDNEYVLPGISGRLGSKWSYYARPDAEGAYRLGVEFRINDRHRLSFTHHETGRSSMVHSFYRNHWHTLQFGVEKNSQEYDDLRVYAQSYLYPFKNHRSHVQTNVTHSSKSIGGSIGWNAMVRPGIEFQIQYEHQNNMLADESDVENIWLRTQFNFGKSHRKIVPTSNSAINFNRGGISGSLVDSQGRRIKVADVKLRVNDRSLPQLSSGGHYYISEMRPGTYTVSVDERNLPIEYKPEKNSVTVEVRASAITNVDFTLNTKFGFAGRVIYSDGSQLPDTLLTIKDSSGKHIKSISTNSFGYYRVDELPAGEYLVALQSNPSVTAVVELRDDYLFNQNLVVKKIEK